MALPLEYGGPYTCTVLGYDNVHQYSDGVDETQTRYLGPTRGKGTVDYNDPTPVHNMTIESSNTIKLTVPGPTAATT